MLRVMTKTTKGSPDGIQVIEFQNGKTYDLPEKLAKAFDIMRVCEKPEIEKPKMMKTAAPENKAVDPKENKSINKEVKPKTAKRRRA